MKTDYPELEGKEVIYSSKYMSVTGIVVGVNYHVGISIVNKNDKEHFLVCLSHKEQYRTKFSTPADYLKTFRSIVKMIKEGTLTYSAINDCAYSVKHLAHMEELALVRPMLAPCPFGQ